MDRALRDDGLYLVNIIDGGRHGRFLRASVRTLQQVFAHVAVIPSSAIWRDSARSTFVLAASQRALDLSHLPEGSPPLSDEELSRYLALEPPLTLTDMHVPVDNLMAPVVEDSFFAATLDPDISAQVTERVWAVGLRALVALLAPIGWLIYRRRSSHRDRAS